MRSSRRPRGPHCKSKRRKRLDVCCCKTGDGSVHDIHKFHTRNNNNIKTTTTTRHRRRAHNGRRCRFRRRRRRAASKHTLFHTFIHSITVCVCKSCARTRKRNKILLQLQTKIYVKRAQQTKQQKVQKLSVCGEAHCVQQAGPATRETHTYTKRRVASHKQATQQ